MVRVVKELWWVLGPASCTVVGLKQCKIMSMSEYHCRCVDDNGTDCGEFAIAFLTSLLNGHEPYTQTYDNELRPHLLTCISSGFMTPFPQAQASRVRKCKAQKVPVNFSAVAICHGMM